jgi:NAD-dependent SIR2 family protein deacetylase
VILYLPCAYENARLFAPLERHRLTYKMIELADFVRIHSIRGAQLMWFLGAGASRAAGFPTAGDLIWRFKRAIYCSRERQPVEVVNIAEESVRQLLQTYFDALGHFPPYGDEDEYAAFFEAAYPSEADRRTFLDPFVRGAKHSYGHRILASLMSIGRLDIAWTTNFDRCFEDASAFITESTANLNVVELETSDRISQVIDEKRWPMLVKLHGDFQSRRLKNTTEELRTQDRRLRDALVRCSSERGLAVIGYSGRDDSVMETLEHVLTLPNPYPGGLFWFVRTEEDPSTRVATLLSEATDRGVESFLVVSPTFDEATSDLLLLIDDVSDAIRTKVGDTELDGRRFPSPVIRQAGDLPLLRINALPIDLPRSCRLIKCEIGGTGAVKEAVRVAEADVIVERRSQGVLAFGPDEELRRVFEQFNIVEFGLYELEPRRFHYDSAESALCYGALTRALTRRYPLLARTSSRRRTIYVDPDAVNDGSLKSLKQAVGSPIAGVIPKTGLRWSEAVDISIRPVLRSLWLCLQPSIWAEISDDEAMNDLRKAFIRSRFEKRYNRQMNSILSAWGTLLTCGEDSIELAAFEKIDGIDAEFKIGVRPARSLKDRIHE